MPSATLFWVNVAGRVGLFSSYSPDLVVQIKERINKSARSFYPDHTTGLRACWGIALDPHSRNISALMSMLYALNYTVGVTPRVLHELSRADSTFAECARLVLGKILNEEFGPDALGRPSGISDGENLERILEPTVFARVAALVGTDFRRPSDKHIARLQNYNPDVVTTIDMLLNWIEVESNPPADVIEFETGDPFARQRASAPQAPYQGVGWRPPRAASRPIPENEEDDTVLQIGGEGRRRLLLNRTPDGRYAAPKEGIKIKWRKPDAST